MEHAILERLNNDEVVTIAATHVSRTLKRLEDYMESQGIDPDDYRMARIDNGFEIWRA